MTPGYAMKHWWRAERRVGESLKAFARRYAGITNGKPTTSAKWLQRKSRRK